MEENKRLAYLIDIKTISTGECKPPRLYFASLPDSFAFSVPGSISLKAPFAFTLTSSRFLKPPLAITLPADEAALLLAGWPSGVDAAVGWL